MILKCVIFDFDGTLFDSMYIWDTVGEKYIHSLGKSHSPSLREELKSMSLNQAAQYLQKEYTLELSVKEIMDGVNKMIEHYYIYEILPKNGVIPILDHFKKAGVHMCIATATDRYLIESALSRCNMNDYFDAIFTCTEVGRGKDDPAIFREAMEYFHADRGNTIIFEDSLHAVQTAVNDDFSVVAVFDKSEKQQDALRKLSRHYITDFEHFDIH